MLPRIYLPFVNKLITCLPKTISKRRLQKLGANVAKFYVIKITTPREPSAGLDYMAEVAHATGPALRGPAPLGKIICCARVNTGSFCIKVYDTELKSHIK